MKPEKPNRHDIKNALNSVKRLADMLPLLETLTKADKALVAAEIRHAAQILETALWAHLEPGR